MNRYREDFSPEELKAERWKDIEEYRYRKYSNGNIYERPMYRISNLGRVMSDYGQGYRIMSVQVNSHDQLVIMMTGKDVSGKATTEMVGLLVARYFVPNPQGYPHIDFKDGNSLNCRAENIEWTPLTEKQRQQYKAMCKKVNKYTLKGKYICTYDNLAEAADDNDCQLGGISTACRRNGKFANFMWKYDEDSPAGKDIEAYSGKLGFIYEQYDKKTGNFLKTYDSMDEVAKALGRNVSDIQANIRNCCFGKRPTAYGYVWKSKEKGVE